MILNIYLHCNENADVVCCAPTGQAARKLSESTGMETSTIHSALGLFSDENVHQEPEQLEADVILIDEMSMTDIFLFRHLLNSLGDLCQLILVGDVDQLPSVGPGAVLRELIESGVIPVIRLDKVFRQDSDNLIALNAERIRNNVDELEYREEDFHYIFSKHLDESADILVGLYMEEVARIGMDNVVLLSPFRVKTETGVNALNERLHDIVNPHTPDKPEIAYMDRVFRQGDKMMQTKNKKGASNGDVGYIIQIRKRTDEAAILVDFGNGRVVEYDKSELDQLDYAFANTIHKSQGSEYKVVLINLQWAHRNMLSRQLVYTAITRAKEKVVIVGQKRAIKQAINNKDTEKRNTLLAARLGARESELLRVTG